MKTAPASLPEGLQILREKDRFKLTAISRVQAWRLEREGRFPKRIQLGDNSVGWIRHELECWIKAKMAGR
jgi:predicted DNA-binding transcriptional regulator AlpA